MLTGIGLTGYELVLKLFEIPVKCEAILLYSLGRRAVGKTFGP
jgi:hypothetical protein